MGYIIIKERGTLQVRNTIQKNLIRNAVIALDHPTAEDVYQHLHAENPSISRATVYRNLNTMEQNGELRRVIVPDGADIFDKTTMQHYHVKCTCCGSVADISGFIFPPTSSAISDYEITGHELVFLGRCPECKNEINL